jgi:G3E family GTPase
MEYKIPITIITGFLGAGKTTFLNHVLKENHGKKIVVIQNEFGDRIGLEEAMVINKNNVMEWIEFPNGCLCCTVKEEMLVAIENLVNKNPNIDSIFIETDGLADPEPLVRSLWVDTELDSTVYLDAIICIVDSVFFLQELGFDCRFPYENHSESNKYKNEAYRQVAFADVILLNKADRVSNTKNLEIILSKINPLAKHYHTVNGKISLQNVLNINAFDIRSADYFEKYINDCCNEPNEMHNLEIRAITIQVDGFTTVSKVNQWLAYLLWEQNTMSIYRVKGMINVEESDEKYNLQAVMQTFDLQPSGILWDPSKKTRTNKITIVGKNLKENLADNFFNKCIR